MDPRVTVIIPTYNRAEWLPESIDGVLAQTFQDFELLVLDDASTDSTAEVALRYREDRRVRYLKHETNLGIARNRNFGVRHAKGIYVAMLDSDDLWLHPGKLQAQVDILDAEPGCGMVGTDAVVVNGAGAKIGTIRNLGSDATIRRAMFVKNHFVQSSVLIRRQVFDEVGMYDEEIPIWEDYDLWLRIGKKFLLRNIRRPLTGYRIHDSNVSRTAGAASLAAFRLIYARHGRDYPLRGCLLARIWVGAARQRWKRPASEA